MSDELPDAVINKMLELAGDTEDEGNLYNILNHPRIQFVSWGDKGNGTFALGGREWQSEIVCQVSNPKCGPYGSIYLGGNDNDAVGFFHFHFVSIVY
jgi:hypothetical protein